MKATKSLLALSILAAAGSANATMWNVTMHADNAFPALSGNLVMDFTGTWDDVTKAGTWSGNTHAVGLVPLSLDYTQSFTMNKATGGGVLSHLVTATCVEHTTGACIGFGDALLGPIFNTVAPPQADPNVYKTKIPFTPADGAVLTWTLQVNQSATLSDGSTINVYLPNPMTVTLSAVPVPAAAWLFGSGLLGLAGTARRRRAATAA